MPDLIVERADGVVRATLNRPERKNALTLPDVRRRWPRSSPRSTPPPADRALVLRGAARAPSRAGWTCRTAARTGRAGPGHARGDGPHPPRRARAAPAHQALDRRGRRARGGGGDVARDRLRPRRRLDAGRGSAPSSCAGASPIDFGGSWLLPRLVGMGKAKELALLGDFIDADEALRIGLVSRVVNPDELDHAVDARGPSPRHRARPSRSGATSSCSQASLAADVRRGRSPRSPRPRSRNLRTEDAAEAIAAFLEKRDAQFRGR